MRQTRESSHSCQGFHPQCLCSLECVCVCVMRSAWDNFDFAVMTPFRRNHGKNLARVVGFDHRIGKIVLLRGALEVLDALSAMRPDGHRYTGSILDEMVYSSCTFLGSSDCSSWHSHQRKIWADCISSTRPDHIWWILGQWHRRWRRCFCGSVACGNHWASTRSPRLARPKVAKASGVSKRDAPHCIRFFLWTSRVVGGYCWRWCPWVEKFPTWVTGRP